MPIHVVDKMEEPLGERIAKLEERIAQRATYVEVHNVKLWILAGALTFGVVLAGVLISILQSVAQLIQTILTVLPKPPLSMF